MIDTLSGATSGRDPGARPVFGNAVTAALAALTLTLGISPSSAGAQAYPTKPIRLIVPFAPGGGTDIVARTIAQKLTEALGQTVVADNRPGGGGTIGAETTVRANPDGYTMILVSNSYAANAALYRLPYDPVQDIEPVILIGDTGFVVCVNQNVPVRSVKELIAADKAKPGSFNYASTGTGGITHLASEYFNQMAGTKLVHVPYKGTGPALNDLLGGQIQIQWGSLPALVPHLKGNRVRGLAVTMSRRTNVLPDMPTVAETLPGYEVGIWYGVWGPRPLPRPVIDRWNAEVNRIVQSQEMKDRMATEAIEPAGGPPQRLRDQLQRDVSKWQAVVKNGNIRPGS